MATTLLPPATGRDENHVPLGRSDEKPAAADGRRRWSGRAARVVLLVALLGGHLAVRLHHNSHVGEMPGARSDYSRSFGHSLSLLLGRGFNDVAVIGTPAAKPIDDFLWLRRGSLTREELDAYAADMPSPSQDPHYGNYRPLASTRILDLHLTAFLWRVFGVSWAVLYVATVFASTFCCLLIFLIGRRLGGGFWPGLLAAAVFFASPMEKFLTGWSVRDSSPLWFAAAGFCVLAHFFDRKASPRRYALGGLLLGAVVVLGTGWRMDALLLVPFLGVAAAVAAFAASRSVTSAAAAVMCFAAGGMAAHLLIGSLGPQERQSAGTGFHMAYYGEAVRSNVLGVENSCQVAWCDMRTLMEARRYDRSARRSDEPLLYISDRYGDVCREMYFGLLRYNAYRWAAGFPRVWWSALRGHPDDAANFPGWSGYRDSLLDAGRPSGWPTLDLGPVEARLPYVLPILVVVGAFVSARSGPRRVPAAALALFTAYFAAVTFAVLPMQKNLAMMLVPACTFAGVGLWAVGRSLRPSRWRELRQGVTPRRCVVTLAVVTATAALWVGTCAACRHVSGVERGTYVTSILRLAETGEAAPETLRGPKAFHVSIPTGSAGDDVGYLLAIRGGAQPGTLVCRHRRVGDGEFRPQVFQTRHPLAAGIDQYFFVSCLQGGRLGDPRAYACTVHVEGDAEIRSSTRVDLAGWDKLAVSTAFAADDWTHGSPRVEGTSARWSATSIPVHADSRAGRKAANEDWEGLLFRPPQSFGPQGAPVSHVAVRDRADGTWRLLVSDGRSFKERGADTWRPTLEWLDVCAGDFDGDGVTDLAGRERTEGKWWVSTAIDGPSRSIPFGGWNPAAAWRHVRRGDFDGNGLDDLVGFVAEGGQWWAGLSDGSRFANVLWGAWPAQRELSHVETGDFDGDGRADLVAYEAGRNIWAVLLSREDGFRPGEWGTSPVAGPGAIGTGDLDGDGRTDLVAVSASEPRGCVGLSTGAGFEFLPFRGVGPADLIRCADLDGDGADEPLLVSLADGTIRRGRRTSDGFAFDEYGRTAGAIRFLVVGDFDGDGREDLAAFLDDRSVQVGSSKEGRLRFGRWLERLESAAEAEPLAIRGFDAP